ncbi:MAG: helix-hairpin-helix domain-containing protein [Anaerolineales bacterium]
MRAYLVAGAESTGTRLVTQILLAAGCRGDRGHAQRWDTRLPEGETPIVWRRSFPHGDTWPLLKELLGYLGEAGYAVTVVVTTRDWWATARSQVRHGHAHDEAEALAHLQEAYRRIFAALEEQGGDYQVVGYEGLVQRPETVIPWLCEQLGLPTPARRPAIYDGNAAYEDQNSGGDGVRITWQGSRVTRRLIAGHEWSRATDFVQEVADAALAAELLTSPEPFAVAEDEPLLALKGIGPHTVGLLALGGVASLAALADLSAEEIRALASRTSLGRKQLTTWVRAAQKIIQPETEEDAS